MSQNKLNFPRISDQDSDIASAGFGIADGLVSGSYELVRECGSASKISEVGFLCDEIYAPPNLLNPLSESRTINLIGNNLCQVSSDNHRHHRTPAHVISTVLSLGVLFFKTILSKSPIKAAMQGKHSFEA